MRQRTKKTAIVPVQMVQYRPDITNLAIEEILNSNNRKELEEKMVKWNKILKTSEFKLVISYKELLLKKNNGKNFVISRIKIKKKRKNKRELAKSRKRN